MNYYAHNYDGVTHLLSDHLHSVATLCGDGLYYNIGLLHDFGKYRPNFQQYLFGETFAPEEKTHSIAGARFLLDKTKSSCDPITIAIGMIAIACHHTGLSDNIATRFSGDAANAEYQQSLNDESSNVILKPMNKIVGDLAMHTRMALSRLVDADWQDTASYYNNHPVYTFNNLQTLRDKLIQTTNQYSIDTSINKIRHGILQDCLNAAGNTPGWFSLSVPTGGGKTISGMAFALDHAIKHNKQRIIVAIPYTSIIDQTHQVYSDIFGEVNVLAHHSNITPSYHYRQKSQRWENPIIVTTSVQFLETLMANKTTKLRKLHNIRNSVIIIDESQMLPLHMLDVTMSALKSLVDDFGCTIVLSTATQTDYSKFGVTPTEIIQNPKELFEKMRRTQIEYVHDLDIQQAIIHGESSLTIVNTRKSALALHNHVSQHTDCVYLSAYMCPIHRKRVIADIKSRLVNGDNVKIISTQLIEAGVDIDLPIVYREIAGVDNIIQAAGRCNRNGNSQIGKVIVFGAITEKLPPSIRLAIGTTYKVMHTEDLNSYSACDSYMQSLLNDANLDEYKIKSCFSDRPHLIKFAEIAMKYKIIDDSAYTILCPIDSGFDIENLAGLQKYSVSVYKKDLEQLKTTNIIEEVENLEDVYILKDPRWYHPELGIVVDLE